MKPGRSVASPRSMTRAPAGVAESEPTASMREPVTTTTAGEETVSPRPSNIRAAFRTTVSGSAERAETATKIAARNPHVLWSILCPPFALRPSPLARRSAPTLLPGLLNQLRDEPRPAGLVRGPETCAVVSVEILEEENVVAEMGIPLELLGAAVDRPPAVAVAQEEMRQ